MSKNLREIALVALTGIGYFFLFPLAFVIGAYFLGTPR